jgi:hypothetical protein
MTEVEKVHGLLVEHSIVRGIRDMKTHCKCGWVSVSQADGWHEHTRHQAERIVDAQRKAKANAAQNERRRHANAHGAA